MAQVITLTLMVLAAAFSRLIPHPWNFTAIGAMALFGGAYFSSKKQSLLIPMLALFLSDLILGLHSTMLFVYAGFALIVVLGWALRKDQPALKVGAFALLSSFIFFAVSNFGVWMMGAMYPKTLAGLAECYIAAVPFFGNQIAGDLFFSGVLFGGYAFAKKMSPTLSAQAAK